MHEKTCTKKHEKHVQKTRARKNNRFFVFLFFSCAENTRKKHTEKKQLKKGCKKTTEKTIPEKTTEKAGAENNRKNMYKKTRAEKHT
jgi:hypothetical protein